MSVLEKIKAALRGFMMGRHGADELSMAIIILSLILSIVGSITGITLIASPICLALYIYAMFRMFSRNHAKRYVENQKYLTVWNKSTGEIKQFFVRLKNIRKYKYFKCPQCKSRLRMPRKVGEKTVTCGKCHHVFKMKA